MISLFCCLYGLRFLHFGFIGPQFSVHSHGTHTLVSNTFCSLWKLFKSCRLRRIPGVLFINSRQLCIKLVATAYSIVFCISILSKAHDSERTKTFEGFFYCQLQVKPQSWIQITLLRFIIRHMKGNAETQHGSGFHKMSLSQALQIQGGIRSDGLPCHGLSVTVECRVFLIMYAFHTLP